MQENDKPVLVYATYPSLTAAEEAGVRLVQSRLAACVNILPSMTSIYRWEGKLERAAEAVLIAKTRSSLAQAVVDDVKAHHTYETPAALILPIAGGSPDYCRWLMDETAPQTT